MEFFRSFKGPALAIITSISMLMGCSPQGERFPQGEKPPDLVISADSVIPGCVLGEQNFFNERDEKAYCLAQALEGASFIIKNQPEGESCSATVKLPADFLNLAFGLPVVADVITMPGVFYPSDNLLTFNIPSEAALTAKGVKGVSRLSIHFGLVSQFFPYAVRGGTQDLIEGYRTVLIRDRYGNTLATLLIDRASNSFVLGYIYPDTRAVITDGRIVLMNRQTEDYKKYLQQQVDAVDETNQQIEPTPASNDSPQNSSGGLTDDRQNKEEKESFNTFTLPRPYQEVNNFLSGWRVQNELREVWTQAINARFGRIKSDVIREFNYVLEFRAAIYSPTSRQVILGNLNSTHLDVLHRNGILVSTDTWGGIYYDNQNGIYISGESFSLKNPATGRVYHVFLFHDIPITIGPDDLFFLQQHGYDVFMGPNWEFLFPSPTGKDLSRVPSPLTSGDYYDLISP